MKNYIRIMAACAAMIVAMLGAGPASASDKVLNLFIWSDYLGPDTLANFTKETGIKVNIDVFDSSEMLEAKMLAGKSGYDVIVPNGAVLTRLIQAGVVQPLDKAKLPHLQTQDPAIAARAAAGRSGVCAMARISAPAACAALSLRRNVSFFDAETYIDWKHPAAPRISIQNSRQPARHPCLSAARLPAVFPKTLSRVVLERWPECFRCGDFVFRRGMGRG